MQTTTLFLAAFALAFLTASVIIIAVPSMTLVITLLMNELGLALPRPVLPSLHSIDNFSVSATAYGMVWIWLILLLTVGFNGLFRNRLLK